MTTRGRRAHRRVFRVLLRLYPAWFRETYEEEMTLLFSTRLERTEGAWGVIRLWWRTSVDAVVTATALRRNDSGGRGLQMNGILQDTRYTARRLLRSPVFTIGVVALLAIGIGANTSVFTLVDALILRPPPWSEPDRVVHIYQDSDDGEPNANSFPATRDMATYTDVFEAVAATAPSSASWDGPDGPTPVATEYTTSGYMEVLGLHVQRGRWFGPEHDAPGGPLAAVVSAGTWRRRFGADSDLVGRTVEVNGQPVTVIGIGPEGLTSTMTPLVTDFWLSISSTPVGGPYQVTNLERRSDHWYLALARLQPGVSVDQAQAAMDALAVRLAEDYPEYDRGRGITVFASGDVRLHPAGDGDLLLAGGLLSAIAFAVLLLTCANLANLLLLRGLDRSGEMAVRSALGAPRSRVGRLFLIESALLATAGAIGGLLLTRWALAAVPALPLADVLGASLDVHVDLRVVLFTLGLLVVTAFLFGLAPAIRTARADVGRALRDDRRGASSAGAPRLRGALVSVQAGASLVLVLCTGLMVRSLAALQTIDPGVDVDRVAFLRLDWSRSGGSGEEARASVDALRSRIEALPGIEAAALTSRLPAQGGGSTTTEIEGYTPPAGTDAVEMPVGVVSDGYFETLGVPLVAGRPFGPDDSPDGDGVSIIVSEGTARRLWGDADPIGRRMRGQGSEAWTRTVVGVVGDVPVVRLGERPSLMTYFSTRQSPVAPPYLIARASGDPAAMLTPLRDEVAAVLPSLTVTGQGTLAGHFGESLATPRFAARAMGAFSVLALILAGLGVYAVVSFTVARRASELGIRIALGAERSGVVRMVVMETFRVVGLGLAGGLLASALLSSRLQGLLFGVPALDPLVFGAAVSVLVAVAWIAAWVPARRAARYDPVEALRVS